MIVVWIFIGVILVVGVTAGIATDIKYNQLGPQLSEWPTCRRRKGQAAKAGKTRYDPQDDDLIDVVLTAAALDELEDMFKK